LLQRHLQAFDAYAALRYLSTLKVVDAEPVALFGQSIGGAATLYAIGAIWRRNILASGFAPRSLITLDASLSRYQQ